MKFARYQHIERWGTDEVEGIEIGKCYLFPKLDGTNASIWLDGEIKAGSRNRQLHLQGDNQGFYHAILNDSQFDGIKKCLQERPNLRFFGEWLVKHTISDYRDSAWRRFYVFDVVEEKENTFRYLPYEEYKELCDHYGIEYIPALKIINNPTYEDILFAAQNNHYLLPEDKVGEGIICKNFEFVNKYQRTTWAKVVLSEFKENFYKKMGSPEKDNKLIEEEIIEKYCTEAFIEKTYAKVANDRGGWKSQYIPHLLGLCFTEFVKEETYNFVKKYKNPKIDFKTLNLFLIRKIKRVKKELFS